MVGFGIFAALLFGAAAVWRTRSRLQGVPHEIKRAVLRLAHGTFRVVVVIVIVAHVLAMGVGALRVFGWWCAGGTCVDYEFWPMLWTQLKIVPVSIAVGLLVAIFVAWRRAELCADMEGLVWPIRTDLHDIRRTIVTSDDLRRLERLMRDATEQPARQVR